MKFNNEKEMYDFIVGGSDLYNAKTGQYVFVYNDNGAFCEYILEEECAKKVAAKAVRNDEYWGAFLGIGGNIYDDPMTWCKENYHKDGWEETIIMELNWKSGLEEAV